MTHSFSWTSSLAWWVSNFSLIRLVCSWSFDCQCQSCCGAGAANCCSRMLLLKEKDLQFWCYLVRMIFLQSIRSSEKVKAKSHLHFNSVWSCCLLKTGGPMWQLRSVFIRSGLIRKICSELGCLCSQGQYCCLPFRGGKGCSHDRDFHEAMAMSTSTAADSEYGYLNFYYWHLSAPVDPCLKSQTLPWVCSNVTSLWRDFHTASCQPGCL